MICKEFFSFLDVELDTCHDYALDCDDLMKKDGCSDDYVQYGCKKSCDLCDEGM